MEIERDRIAVVRLYGGECVIGELSDRLTPGEPIHLFSPRVIEKSGSSAVLRPLCEFEKTSRLDVSINASRVMAVYTADEIEDSALDLYLKNAAV